MIPVLISVLSPLSPPLSPVSFGPTTVTAGLSSSHQAGVAVAAAEEEWFFMRGEVSSAGRIGWCLRPGALSSFLLLEAIMLRS